MGRFWVVGLLIWLVEGGADGVKNWQSFNHKQSFFCKWLVVIKGRFRPKAALAIVKNRRKGDGLTYVGSARRGRREHQQANRKWNSRQRAHIQP